MTTAIGVDSSTRSCTVEVRDLESGVIVSRASLPHPDTTPPRSEQHPQAWWTAMEGLVVKYGQGAEAISVAAQQHGMVVLDGGGAPLRAAKLWNDTESAPEAAALVARLGPEAWAQRCGTVPVAALTISKLAWLAIHEPEVHELVRQVLLPHDWLTLQLTGSSVTDRGDASGTGYWSPAVGWDSGLLGFVGLDSDVCPEVLDPTATAGRWGSMLVGPGTGDNMAAALGMALQPGDVSVSIGTSGVVAATASAPTADPTGIVAGFADATGHYLPLACTLNAAKVTDAFARLLGMTVDELGAAALEAPAGSNGVVLVPHLDGERTPNRPNATGHLMGFGSDVSREVLARAAFEGVVCSLLEALDALGSAGVDTDGRLLITGGGARSAAYQRVLADLSGRPVTVLVEQDHVAAGACVQAAAVATGATLAEVGHAWGLGRGPVVEPSLETDRSAIRAAYRHAVAASATEEHQ